MGGEDIRTEADEGGKGKEKFVGGGGGEILIWRGQARRRLSGRASTLGFDLKSLDMEG